MKKLILTSITLAVLGGCQTPQNPQNPQTVNKVIITDGQRANFNLLDRNNDGELNRFEMRSPSRKWMNDLGYKESKQVKLANQEFNNYDLNHDQKVNIDEFSIGNKTVKTMKPNNFLSNK